MKELLTMGAFSSIFVESIFVRHFVNIIFVLKIPRFVFIVRSPASATTYVKEYVHCDKCHIFFFPYRIVFSKNI